MHINGFLLIPRPRPISYTNLIFVLGVRSVIGDSLDPLKVSSHYQLTTSGGPSSGMPSVSEIFLKVGLDSSTGF